MKMRISRHGVVGRNGRCFVGVWPMEKVDPAAKEFADVLRLENVGQLGFWGDPSKFTVGSEITGDIATHTLENAKREANGELVDVYRNGDDGLPMVTAEGHPVIMQRMTITAFKPGTKCVRATPVEDTIEVVSR